MDQLLAFDRLLFEKINLDWTNGFFDWLFPSITDLHKSTGFLIAILPLIAFWIYRHRIDAFKGLLVLIVAVGASDLVSYRVIKHAVERPRPVEAGVPVTLRTKHHSGSSFPSNHAANMFAAATVLSSIFAPATLLWFLIAVAVAYSRVYVGVHYPLDVIGGALVGFTCAHLTIWVFRRIFRSVGDFSRARSSSRSS